MRYHGSYYDKNTWDVYWFEKNLQGDIVALYNDNGAQLVSYEYDAWGNHTVSYTNGIYSAVAANNPFRYRGYYYDADLELYYLNSRYYDSYTGRFLNADKVLSGVNGSLQGFNLYAYCFNNPVNLTDGNGNWPKSWEEFWSEWKEESFVYNVIIKSITAYVGAGVGIGIPAGVVEETTHAEKGIAFEDGEFKAGEFGENSVSINAGVLSLSFSYSGFVDEKGQREPWEYDLDLSLGPKTPGKSFVFSYHTDFSISVISIFENFQEYASKHWR